MPQGPPPQAVDASKPLLEGCAVCAANVESRRETFFEPHDEHVGGRAVSPARTRSSVFFPQSEQRYSRRGMEGSRRRFYGQPFRLVQIPLADEPHAAPRSRGVEESSPEEDSCASRT